MTQITRNLVMSKLDNNKRFLPQKCFVSIFSEENITAALPGASQDLLRFVNKKATRLFATVLKASRKSNTELVAIMDSFHEKGLDDTRLADGHEPQCVSAGDTKCVHDGLFNVLHNKELWDMTAVQEFFDQRWSFLAPVFSASEFGHDLAPSAILPFDWVESDPSKNPVGGFSRVQKARIHTDHHEIPSEVRTPMTERQYSINPMCPQDGLGLLVAIKELQPSQDTSYPDPKTAWEQELSALKGTRRHHHEHLTSAIAAFHRNKKYYLVFEWADGGSLENFWEKVPVPALSPQLVQDVLEQLHGLADALVCLHGHGNGESKDIKSNTDKLGGDSKANDSGHYRHGDLKPENILRFRCSDQPKKLGTLQIADLGLARHHTMATRDRIGPTSMRFGTVMYESPEGHPVRAKAKPRSRLYDVWSMGCIVLELVIWLLYGYEGLITFREETRDGSIMGDGIQQDLNGTNFYKLANDGNFDVNNVVKDWMQAIQEDDPEFINGKKSALSDLLNLVKMKLLVVRTDDKDNIGESGSGSESGESSTGCRATAPQLKKELEKILSQGKKSQIYLFTGASREDVVSPSKPREANQHLAIPPEGLPTVVISSEDSPRSEDPSAGLNTQYEHVRREI